MGILAQLDYLLLISPTTERFSLKGSTNKRKALIVNTPSQKFKAISDAAFDYRHAYTIADGNCNLQPLVNWYLLESVLVLVSDHAWGKEVKSDKNQYGLPSLKEAKNLLADTKRSILTKNQYDNSYLDKLTCIDVNLCELLLDPKKAEQKGFDNLLQIYLGAWGQMKSVSLKREGLEQLEIIVNLLGASTEVRVKKLHKGLQEIYDALNKML